MVRLNWTHIALDDLRAIYDYTARDSVKYAQITVNKIYFQAEIAIKQPRATRMVPELNDPDIREIISGQYRIIFRVITKEQMDIIRIYHTARKLSSSKI